MVHADFREEEMAENNFEHSSKAQKSNLVTWSPFTFTSIGRAIEFVVHLYNTSGTQMII